MENGYKILWTDHALSELRETYAYLEEHWSETELRNLSVELEEKLTLIKEAPKAFQIVYKDTVRNGYCQKI